MIGKILIGKFSVSMHFLQFSLFYFFSPEKNYWWKILCKYCILFVVPCDPSFSRGACPIHNLSTLNIFVLLGVLLHVNQKCHFINEDPSKMTTKGSVNRVLIWHVFKVFNKVSDINICSYNIWIKCLLLLNTTNFPSNNFQFLKRQGQLPKGKVRPTESTHFAMGGTD